MISIKYTQLWVHDQDAALDFYTNKVGFELREDVTVAEMGDFRWLSVGPANQPDVSIVLMAIPGPPIMDTDSNKAVHELMAKGFAGTVFLISDDVMKDYDELSRARRRVHRGADPTSVRPGHCVPRSVRQQHPHRPSLIPSSGEGRKRCAGSYSPTVPSSSSRTASACPACRAVSLSRCSRTHRRSVPGSVRQGVLSSVRRTISSVRRARSA